MALSRPKSTSQKGIRAVGTDLSRPRWRNTRLGALKRTRTGLPLHPSTRRSTPVRVRFSAPSRSLQRLSEFVGNW